MAEKRKTGRPKGRKPTVTVFARIPPRLAKELKEHVQSVQPRSSINAVIELALERYLATARKPQSDEQE